MKVIAFLTDSVVGDQIIHQLKRIFIADRPPPLLITSQALMLAAEASIDHDIVRLQITMHDP